VNRHCDCRQPFRLKQNRDCSVSSHFATGVFRAEGFAEAYGHSWCGIDDK